MTKKDYKLLVDVINETIAITERYPINKEHQQSQIEVLSELVDRLTSALWNDNHNFDNRKFVAAINEGQPL